MNNDLPIVLLFRGNGWISRLIRWQTNGDYSHAAIQLPDGTIFEAWHSPSGVRVRPPLKSWDGVEAYAVVGMNAEQWHDAIDWVRQQLGKKYDFGGVARFLTRWRKEQDDRWFCSELVFTAVRRGRCDLLSRVQPSQVSPTVLSFSPLLKRTSAYKP